MLAFIQNLSIGETVVIAVIAVLVFGKNLPEVAGRVYAQVRKVRRTVDDLRRETGIDRDINKFRRDMHDIEQEARVVDPLRDAQYHSPRDAVQELNDHRESDPAQESDSSAGEAGVEVEAEPPPQPLGQPMDDPTPKADDADGGTEESPASSAPKT